MWPVLDGVARQQLAGGALVGRSVRFDVPVDDATQHVIELLTSVGAAVVVSTAELVVRPNEIVAGDRVVPVPLLDPTGEAHALVRAVLRVTNRRLPGARVAVVGYDALPRALAGVMRSLGGRTTVVTTDPLQRLAALTDGHHLGDATGAQIAFGGGYLDGDLAAETVIAGPDPADVGEMLDEPRPGLLRVRRGTCELLVIDPVVLHADRPTSWLDLMWATRLVTLAWGASSSGGHQLPLDVQRELAAAALAARGAS